MCLSYQPVGQSLEDIMDHSGGRAPEESQVRCVMPTGETSHPACPGAPADGWRVTSRLNERLPFSVFVGGLLQAS